MLQNGFVANIPKTHCLSKEIYSECFKKFRWEMVLQFCIARGFVEKGELQLRLVSQSIHHYCGRFRGRPSGRTPLMAACRLHHNRVNHLLLIPSYRSSVNSQNSFGITAIHHCCLEVRRTAPLYVIEDLLRQRADPNLQKSDGFTPLLSVIAGSCLSDGQEDVCRALLAGGADPNIKSDYGWTALHEAVNDLNVPVTRALIDYGADLTIRSVEDKTPVDYDPDRRIPFLHNLQPP